MLRNRALATIFSFIYCFAQAEAAESSSPLQAEATVEIQFDGESGTGLILMTGYPASSGCSSSSTTIPNSSAANTATVGVALTSNAPFNTPPLFGTSRTQMINATSTGQYQFPTATGSSQMVTGTAGTDTQNPSGSSTPNPYASLFAGLGTRPDVTWSHVFFWAAVSEIMLGFL
jgi:hypothetical protein